MAILQFLKQFVNAKVLFPFIFHQWKKAIGKSDGLFKKHSAVDY